MTDFQQQSQEKFWNFVGPDGVSLGPFQMMGEVDGCLELDTPNYYRLLSNDSVNVTDEMIECHEEDLLTSIRREYSIMLSMADGESLYKALYPEGTHSAKWCGCEFEHKYQRQIHNLSHLTVGTICKVPK